MYFLLVHQCINRIYHVFFALCIIMHSQKSTAAASVEIGFLAYAAHLAIGANYFKLVRMLLTIVWTPFFIKIDRNYYSIKFFEPRGFSYFIHQTLWNEIIDIWCFRNFTTKNFIRFGNDKLYFVFKMERSQFPWNNCNLQNFQTNIHVMIRNK